MKVKVSFGETTVVVPCGTGEDGVRSIFDKAVARYRRATAKGQDVVINVSSLQTAVDNAILDPDDTICDVLDDKDLLVATFDEYSSSEKTHSLSSEPSSAISASSTPPVFSPSRDDSGNTSGTVATAVTVKESFISHGRPEPPLQHAPTSLPPDPRIDPRRLSTSSQGQPSGPAPSTPSDYDLQRPGQPWPDSQKRPEFQQPHDVGRYQRNENSPHMLGTPYQNMGVRSPASKALPFDEPTHTSRRQGSKNILLKQAEMPAPEIAPAKAPFSNQLSLQRNGPLRASYFYHQPANLEQLRQKGAVGKYKKDAQEDADERHQMNKKQSTSSLQSERSNSCPPSSTGNRRESIEGSAGGNTFLTRTTAGQEIHRFHIGVHAERLGIRVRGYRTSDNRDLGVFVGTMEEGSVAAKEGLQILDRILRVNNADLTTMSNDQAVAVFRSALSQGAVYLEVSRSPTNNDDSQQYSPTASPHVTAAGPQNTPSLSSAAPQREKGQREIPHNLNVEKAEERQDVDLKMSTNSLAPSGCEVRTVHTIELTKGTKGLGFSVTSRDVSVGDDSDRPVFVKSITPNGAALLDGRLKANDRLIEVNGVEMTGKTQQEAVQVLRAASGKVTLKVSRQEIISMPAGTSDVNNLLTAEANAVSTPVKQTHTQAVEEDTVKLTFNIPLPACGSTGLGISVKGKTATTSHQHNTAAQASGLYIKSILPGGAAAKDGNLLANDRIVIIDGEDLSEISDAEAFDVIRQALARASQQEFIKITVSRVARHQRVSHSPHVTRTSEIAIDVAPSKAKKPFALDDKAKSDHGSDTASQSSQHSEPITASPGMLRKLGPASSHPLPMSSSSSSSLASNASSTLANESVPQMNDAGGKQISAKANSRGKLEAGRGYVAGQTSLLQQLKDRHTSSDLVVANAEEVLKTRVTSSRSTGGTYSPQLVKATLGQRMTPMRSSTGKMKTKSASTLVSARSTTFDNIAELPRRASAAAIVEARRLEDRDPTDEEFADGRLEMLKETNQSSVARSVSSDSLRSGHQSDASADSLSAGTVQVTTLQPNKVNVRTINVKNMTKGTSRRVAKPIWSKSPTRETAPKEEAAENLPNDKPVATTTEKEVKSFNKKNQVRRRPSSAGASRSKSQNFMAENEAVGNHQGGSSSRYQKELFDAGDLPQDVDDWSRYEIGRYPPDATLPRVKSRQTSRDSLTSPTETPGGTPRKKLFEKQHSLDSPRFRERSGSLPGLSENGRSRVPIYLQDGEASSLVDRPPSGTYDDNESMTSAEELPPSLQRGGPGRQTISEKRKTTLDAEKSEFYQELKRQKAIGDSPEKLRHESGGAHSTMSAPANVSASEEHLVQDSLGELDSSGLTPFCQTPRRAASLESLHFVMYNTTDPISPSALKNLSFRRAVDRSFENGHVHDERQPRSNRILSEGDADLHRSISAGEVRGGEDYSLDESRMTRPQPEAQPPPPQSADEKKAMKNEKKKPKKLFGFSFLKGIGKQHRRPTHGMPAPLPPLHSPAVSPASSHAPMIRSKSNIDSHRILPRHLESESSPGELKRHHNAPAQPLHAGFVSELTLREGDRQFFHTSSGDETGGLASRHTLPGGSGDNLPETHGSSGSLPTGFFPATSHLQALADI